MFWLFVCLTAAGAFGAGMAWAQVRTRVGTPLPELPPGQDHNEDSQDTAPPKDHPVAWNPPGNGTELDELWRLQPGDVVVHSGVDHCAETVVRMAGSGHHIMIAHLEAADDALVLSDVPRPRAWMARRARSHLLGANQPDTVVHQGLRYRRQKRVEVRARSSQAPTAAQLYEGPDGVVLWVLARADGVEVWEARVVREGGLMVLRR